MDNYKELAELLITELAEQKARNLAINDATLVMLKLILQAIEGLTVTVIPNSKPQLMQAAEVFPEQYDNAFEHYREQCIADLMERLDLAFAS